MTRRPTPDLRTRLRAIADDARDKQAATHLSGLAAAGVPDLDLAIGVAAAGEAFADPNGPPAKVAAWHIMAQIYNPPPLHHDPLAPGGEVVLAACAVVNGAPWAANAGPRLPVGSSEPAAVEASQYLRGGGRDLGEARRYAQRLANAAKGLVPTLTASEEQRLLLGQNAVVLWRMDPQPRHRGSYIVGDGDRERPAWLSWSTVPDVERLVGPPPTWHQEDSPVPRRGWVQTDRGRVAYEVVGEQPWEVAEGGIVPAGWYWRVEVRPVVYAVVVVTRSRVSAWGSVRQSVLLVEYPKLSRAGVPAMCLPGGKVEDGEEPAEAARREFAEETGLRSDGFTVAAEPFWCGESHNGKPMWAYEAELNLDVDWSTAKRWFSNDGEVRMVPVRGIAAHYVPEFLPAARRVLGAYLLHREEVG